MTEKRPDGTLSEPPLPLLRQQGGDRRGSGVFLWYSCLMTTLDRAEVGEALRRRRKELGLTLGDVARSMGTSDGYCGSWSRG